MRAGSMDMDKRDDFNFEWLPGFREMMACQNNVMADNSMAESDNQNASNQDSSQSIGNQNSSPNISNPNSSQNTSNQNPGNIDKLLPPEQLQQEEQQYGKDYEYLIQLLPLVAREVWVVTDALLDQYEYTGSAIYSEYPDKVTILKIVDMVYDKLKYREQQETMQADDETVMRNPYFVEESLRDGNTPFRTLIQIMLHWNINYRRQRYYRRQRVFSRY